MQPQCTFHISCFLEFSVSVYEKNVRKFTSKSSDLRTCFPEGQTDAEVFVQKILIFHLYMQQIFIYSNFKTKIDDFSSVYKLLRMSGIKSLRGEEFTRLRGHACKDKLNHIK